MIEEKNRFKKAREKYKPNTIKYLLIAEAPPQLDSGRFFYFEDVQKGDSLFLEVMKVLYGIADSKIARLQKDQILTKFMNDGFYLEDSVDEPIQPGESKKRKIKENISSLKQKIVKISDKETKIILIASTVYVVCYKELVDDGFNVVNTEALPFPGSGQQKKFREKFEKLLKEIGFDFR